MRDALNHHLSDHLKHVFSVIRAILAEFESFQNLAKLRGLRGLQGSIFENSDLFCLTKQKQPKAFAWLRVATNFFHNQTKHFKGGFKKCFRHVFGLFRA